MFRLNSVSNTARQRFGVYRGIIFVVIQDILQAKKLKKRYLMATLNKHVNNNNSDIIEGRCDPSKRENVCLSIVVFPEQDNLSSMVGIQWNLLRTMITLVAKVSIFDQYNSIQ